MQQRTYLILEHRKDSVMLSVMISIETQNKSKKRKVKKFYSQFSRSSFHVQHQKIELNHKSLFAVPATLNAHALWILFEISWWFVGSDRSAMANLLLACIAKTYDILKLQDTLVKSAYCVTEFTIFIPFLLVIAF